MISKSKYQIQGKKKKKQSHYRRERLRNQGDSGSSTAWNRDTGRNGRHLSPMGDELESTRTQRGSREGRAPSSPRGGGCLCGDPSHGGSEGSGANPSRGWCLGSLLLRLVFFFSIMTCKNQLSNLIYLINYLFSLVESYLINEVQFFISL